MKFMQHWSLSTAVVGFLTVSLVTSFVATKPQKVVIEVHIMGQWLSTELMQVGPSTLLGEIKLNNEPLVRFSTSSSAASESTQNPAEITGENQADHLLG